MRILPISIVLVFWSTAGGVLFSQEAPAVIPVEPAVPTTQVPNPEVPIVIQRMGLPDQFEKMHEVAFPTDKPVVVTLGDRDGSDMLSGWVDAIVAAHDGTVNYMGMADLGEVPKAVRGMVRKAIKKETPNFPVLLDWKGEVAAFLRARPGIGNLFIVDHTGVVRAHFAGKVNSADLAKVAAIIEQAIKDAPPVPVVPPAATGVVAQ